MGQTWSLYFPPAPKFNVSDIPDLSGKVMIVTGGSSGIGKEIVRGLVSHNAKVYLAARSAEKANAAIEELKKDTGKEAQFLQVDLASVKSVRRAAEEFLGKEQQLHALINNGGVMFLTATPESQAITEDGYDIQWGTNVVGPFYFTQQLMPALLAAAENSPDKKARVLFTSSIVQSDDINFETTKDTPARKKMSASNRYGQSKFANVVLARELARRYGDKGIVSTSLYPGGIKTDLQRHLPKLTRKILDLALHPAPMGALTALWGATSPEAADLNGKYLVPWARVGVPSVASQKPELGEKLWSELEEQVKGK
ncbi:NAD-binding protein [Fomitiporia mediterranea MF3/22]|uniref:NAD-binding protein n=1 Tax=Fomitiporia mediterranea (strain MF3/22) TaxID=694068 RepID=UPI0004409845|nr:NAD-binding protein [Fomitiporia mediterranea MF3/22]EJD00113.1 NAD-binding protein [Fomitiporia mediterranea MF3/22]